MRPYTDAEKALVRQHYANTPNRELAKRLNRTPISVRLWAGRHGLQKSAEFLARTQYSDAYQPSRQPKRVKPSDVDWILDTPLARHCAVVLAFNNATPPEAPERVKVGDRWAMLTVVERAGYNAGGAVLWRCACDCGGETLARPWDLRTGNKKSCGCIRGKNGR